MTALIIIALMLLGNVRAMVELDCSDNATCISNMAKEIIQSLKQHKSVKLFDVLTIQPLSGRQARSTSDWLTRFMEGHVFSLDWNDYTFTISQPEDMKDVVDLQIYQGRTAKDVSDPNAKKSSSKAEEEKEDDKGPYSGNKLGLRRRKKKKVMQVILPLIFGMKSAGVVMFVFAIVTALTLKAFVASKVALAVTAGMALKRLYDTYGTGVGLQNHPYIYSQYPIDFPSASSHAYSVSGVSPQFVSPDLYNPTAMGTNPHANEMFHQSDATAQQSQQAPTLLINNTRAAERWDGKSKLQQFLEPIVNGFRNALSPIADAFYGAMPATVRGLQSDVSTAKNIENETEAEDKPKEILVAQPRNYIQRKLAYRKLRTSPKKYRELKVSLDRLKNNKDLHDYIKTKKYKFNYPNTYFYPRIKYSVNPHPLYKPNNSRLIPYKKEHSNVAFSTPSTFEANNSDWKPIIPLSSKILITATSDNNSNLKLPYRKLRRRSKRSVNDKNFKVITVDNTKRVYYNKGEARGFFDLLQFLFTSDPFESVTRFTNDYKESVLKDMKIKYSEPGYYSLSHNLLMIGLDIFNSLSGIIHDAIFSEP